MLVSLNDHARSGRDPDYQAESLAITELAADLDSSPVQVMEKLVQTALRLTGAGSAGLSLLENVDGKEQFRWLATAGQFKPLRGSVLPGDFSPCRAVLDRRAALLMSRPERFYPYVAQINPPLLEVLLVPFFRGPTPVGTVWVVSHDASKRFDAEDTRLVTSLTHFAAAATRNIETAGAMQSANDALHHEIRERSLVEDARREISDTMARQGWMYEGLLSTTPDFAYMFDRQGRFQYANRRLLEVWGRKLEDCVGKTCFELGYAQWHHDMHMREIATVIETRAPIRGEVPFTAPLTGIFGVYEYIFTPVFGPGGEVELISGTTRDVTDRKRVAQEREQLLLQLENERSKLAAVIEQAPAFMCTLRGPDHVLEIANERYFQVVGRRDVIGKSVSEAIPELAGQGYLELLKSVFETGQTYSGDELPVMLRRSADGPLERRFVNVVYQAIREADGTIWGIFAHGIDVTDLVASRQAVVESEARFRQMADLMPQIVWTALPDGTLDYYNRRWFEFVQLSPEDMDAARWDLFVHPDDLPNAAAAWKKALETGAPYSIEFRVRGGDGNYRWFLVRALAIRDEADTVTRWIGTCTDMEEHKQSEQKLRKSEARLADIMRTSLDSIVSIDHLGQVTDWNPAAEQTFGYTRDEALGREMAELIIAPATRDMHRNGLAHYLATGKGTILGRRLEVTAMKKGGEEMPVELTVTPATLADPPAFTAFLRDISLRKAAEAERENLLESERAARGEAERASMVKDEFLATLSHEIRTPLNAIMGWAQIMGTSKDPEDIAQGLEVIERNARAQLQIIEDLLDMSRIISGKVRLDVQRVDLSSIVQSAVEATRPAANGKQIRLQSVIDPLLGVVVSGDANRLQQILWNLLSNAIKFTPKEGRVQVILQRVNSHIEISVSDTGEGIKPEFLPYVFDRFRQADASTTRRFGGLGLGLSIVKQLVELHGGSIRVKSDGVGQGSTFTISLPLTAIHMDPDDRDERRHPRAAGLDSKAEEGCIQLNGVRVLVVDDEPDARRLVKRVLEDCHAIVFPAANASEALDILKREKPDAIVSDIGMPGEDGYTLIRRIRALSKSEGGAIPAIALTAYARAEDRVRVINAGFQNHIAKPVAAIELITMVAAVVGRTGGMKSV